MPVDMTVPCGDGVLNLRVGAIIRRDGRVLMVKSRMGQGYYYSVGGRIRFGETAEQAVLREVREETGVRMEIDRLGFVHENYFYGDGAKTRGKLVYELSFFYYMKVPADFSPPVSFREGEHVETLHWVDPASAARLFPEFFRTELKEPVGYVKFITTDER